MEIYLNLVHIITISLTKMIIPLRRIIVAENIFDFSNSNNYERLLFRILSLDWIYELMSC